MIGSSSSTARLEPCIPGDTEHRGSHREPRRRPPGGLIGVEAIGVAPHQAPGPRDRPASTTERWPCPKDAPIRWLPSRSSRRVPWRRTPVGGPRGRHRGSRPDRARRDRSHGRRRALRPGSRPRPGAVAHRRVPSAGRASRSSGSPTPRPAPARLVADRSLQHRRCDTFPAPHRRCIAPPLPRDRSNPPQAAHAAGLPHERHTAAMPAPGSGENTNARRASLSARRRRGALPSGPGFTISTGTHRRDEGATCGSRSAAASDEGQIADRARRRTPGCGRAPGRRRARGSTARDPHAARDGTLARPSQPERRHRREHRRPRSRPRRRTRPACASSHVLHRRRVDPPRTNPHRSPNASRRARATPGIGVASGTMTTARRPDARHLATRSTAIGALVLRRRPHQHRTVPRASRGRRRAERGRDSRRRPRP